MWKRRWRAASSMRPYAERRAGSWCLMGLGRSPVKTSLTSWKTARAMTLSASTGRPKTSREIRARPWAIIAACRLCSWMFSVRVLRMTPQRAMYFMRAR